VKSALCVIALACMLASSASAYAQSEPSVGNNRVISPTVVAFSMERETGGARQLDLLVLWRGSPGWFMRGASSSGGGNGHGGFGQWRIQHWMSYGDIMLTVDLISNSKDFPRDTTVATILGRQIPLGHAVLVDGADTDHPVITATRFFDPSIMGDDVMAAAVRSSSELFEFLRCDAALPNQDMQAMIRSICDRMRP